MDTNGKGITQDDLDLLSEVNDVILWQPDEEAPIYITDKGGCRWSIGFNKGVLCKRRW